MRSRELPPLEFLQECFSYFPKTGQLIWNVRPQSHFKSDRYTRAANSRYAGLDVGTVSRDGHLAVKLGPRLMYVHRIIWKLMTGEDPGAFEVDHKDTDKLNNRWQNLRLADGSGNRSNVRLSRANTSGIKGIRYDEHRDRWAAYVQHKGKQYNLGRFKDLDTAVAVLRKKRQQLHKEFANHG